MAGLTPSERNILRGYLYYRDRPLTAWWLFVAFRRSFALLVGGGCVLAAAFALSVNRTRPGSELTAASFVVAFVLGAVVRDVASVAKILEWWPVTRSVIDWDRVERLLADGPGPGHPSPASPLPPDGAGG